MASKWQHPTAPPITTEGFFQVPPRLDNQFFEDEALGRVFKFHLPSPIQLHITPDLSRFGALVLTPQTLSYLADAERNQPYIRTWDAWGRRVDELVTSEGWCALQELGIKEGIVAIGYENDFNQYSRVYQFIKYHLWTGSCGNVTCPSAMTDGAARLLSGHLESHDISKEERRVFEKAYAHLTSRDPDQAWTSGQWMTERIGGSDVRETETQAAYSPLDTETTGRTASAVDTDGTPLGPWLINGFKWFSSATDSQMTVLLAKTPDGQLSAFYAPMRRRIPYPTVASYEKPTELNGIYLHRLKPKLGTRPLPTAELSLHDLRAYLLGLPGQGTKQISTILNITRVHNTVSAVGEWGRGLAIARAFSRVRKVNGKFLIDTPAYVHSLAAQHVSYRACMHLAYFVVALLGISENPGCEVDPATSPFIDSRAAPSLLRLLTPLAKALTATAAISGLRECMECLGGVGYLDHEDMTYNIARLYRDANVLAIWEGTTDVMAADVVRVLKSASASSLGALELWISTRAKAWKAVESRYLPQRAGPTVALATVSALLSAFLSTIKSRIQGSDPAALRFRGRALLQELGWLVCAVLLVDDAVIDGDEVAWEVTRRWIGGRGGWFGQSCARDVEVIESSSGTEGNGWAGGAWKEEFELDKRIIFGGKVGMDQLDKAKL